MRLNSGWLPSKSINHHLNATFRLSCTVARIDLNRNRNGRREKKNRMKSEIIVFRWNECDYLHKSCPIEWKKNAKICFKSLITICAQLVFCLCLLLAAEFGRDQPSYCWQAVVRRSRYVDRCKKTHCAHGRRHQTYGIFMAIDYLFKCITGSAHRAFVLHSFHLLYFSLALNCSVRCVQRQLGYLGCSCTIFFLQIVLASFWCFCQDKTAHHTIYGDNFAIAVSSSQPSAAFRFHFLIQ